jgi:hypothetical protein
MWRFYEYCVLGIHYQLHEGSFVWILRERFHKMLELERIRGRKVGKIEKKRPYSHACTWLADKKMISSLASNPLSPRNSVFQGGHAGGEAGPSSPVLACHGNVPLL